MRDFYREVASRGAESGFSETWQLTSDGDPAAIVFGITQGGRFLYLLIGADYEKHGRHSPGLQAYDAIIEDWMGRGGNCFDFTIGDEPFKAQFGAEATPMCAIVNAVTSLGRVARGPMLSRIGATS